MDDADLVEAVAADMVARHDGDAARRAYEAAEIAAGIGDELSAEAWHDIANAADRLLRG